VAWLTLVSTRRHGPSLSTGGADDKTSYEQKLNCSRNEYIKTHAWRNYTHMNTWLIPSSFWVFFFSSN